MNDFAIIGNSTDLYQIIINLQDLNVKKKGKGQVQTDSNANIA